MTEEEKRKQWFAVHVLAGQETKVHDNLVKRIKTEEMSDYIFEVLVPTERVSEIKRGKKSETVRKLMPGYVIVNMWLIDENKQLVDKTWQLKTGSNLSLHGPSKFAAETGGYIRFESKTSLSGVTKCVYFTADYRQVANELVASKGMASVRLRDVAEHAVANPVRQLLFCGGRVHQRERAHQLRMLSGQPHSHKASHGEAGKMAGRCMQSLDERGCVVGQSVHVVAVLVVRRNASSGPVAWIVGETLCTMVIGDHAVLLFKQGTLRLKHGMVHQQAVGENDGFWPAAGLFVKEIDAIDQDCWHVF